MANKTEVLARLLRAREGLDKKIEIARRQRVEIKLTRKEINRIEKRLVELNGGPIVVTKCDGRATVYEYSTFGRLKESSRQNAIEYHEKVGHNCKVHTPKEPTDAK